MNQTIPAVLSAFLVAAPAAALGDGAKSPFDIGFPATDRDKIALNHTGIMPFGDIQRAGPLTFYGGKDGTGVLYTRALDKDRGTFLGLSFQLSADVSGRDRLIGEPMIGTAMEYDITTGLGVSYSKTFGQHAGLKGAMTFGLAREQTLNVPVIRYGGADYAIETKKSYETVAFMGVTMTW